MKSKAERLSIFIARLEARPAFAIYAEKEADWHVLRSFLPPRPFEWNRQKAITLPVRLGAAVVAAGAAVIFSD